jgi:TolB protein
VHLLRSPFRFLLTTAVTVTLASLSARAQVEVPVGTATPIGIAPLGGSQGATATQVVSADLKRTGMMAPVGSGKGDFEVSGDAGDSSLTGKLVNHKTGAVVFTLTFEGKPRAAAHAFSDAITKAVTGLPGFASSKVAFISNATGSKELYIADIDGFGARNLTHDGTISASPALNANATKLAYTSYKSGYPDIYLIDLGSNSRSRIASFPGINSGPAFSPDGSQIAMTLSKDGNPEIYVMPSNGGSPTRITRTRGSETSPSWSPTGDRLVYSSDDRGSPQLFVSSASGGNDVDHLITNFSYCTKPDWSPDGKSIAFTTRQGGQFSIVVYDVANRSARLVSPSAGQDPSWTCDSRHLVYANNGHLYILDTVSRQAVPIELGISGCGEPAANN